MITGNNTKMGLAESHNFLTSSTAHSKKLHDYFPVFWHDKIYAIGLQRFDLNSLHI